MSASRSVVVVGHTARLSGGEVQMIRILPAIARRADLRVILGEAGPLVDLLRESGVRVEVCPMSRAAAEVRRGVIDPRSFPWWAAASASGYAVTLGRRLRQLRPDVVHTVTLKAALYGGVAARLARRPCVWQINDLVDEPYLPPAAVWPLRRLARLLPSAVITNSEATLSALRLPPGRGRVVYPPAPPWTPDPAPASGAAGPFEAVMVGRLAPWKGQDVFLRAFAEAFPGGTERAVLLGAPLFGEEAYEVELRHLVDDLGLGGRVEILGFQSDVRSVMGRASVVVHASVTPEPFGQVIVEAMALGRPVVAADAGGPREIVTNGVDGLLCPPGDVAAYARALRRVAGDRALADQLGRAGLRRTSRFSLDRAVEGVLGCYDDAVTP